MGSRLDDIYPHLWAAHGDEVAALDQSLSPRSWTFLFDLASRAGLSADSAAVDVGCGRGDHCFELASRFGCRVVGVDLVFAQAAAAARSESRTPRVQFVQGEMERLPFREDAFDFVWCRDMLEHVTGLDDGLRECARVLVPGGAMLVHTTLATARMEPGEAERIYSPLAICPANMLRERVEGGFATAGFCIAETEDIGAELMEFYEERDGRASRELMRLARMRRMREAWIRQMGQVRYDVVHALYHWVVYLLLGKLTQVVYLLRKAAGNQSATVLKSRKS